MKDLIARLEKAEGPDRELDGEIAVAIGVDLPEPMGDAPPYLKTPTMADGCAAGTYWLVQRSGMSLRTAPAYTASIDAALTLVPDALCKEPSWWGVQRGGLTYFHAWVGSGMERYDTNNNFTEHWAQANTPALALCIAALKARP